MRPPGASECQHRWELTPYDGRFLVVDAKIWVKWGLDFTEYLLGASATKRIAWAGVDLPLGPSQVRGRELREVGSVGKLPEQPVGVLVDAALPGLAGSQK